MWLAGLRGAMAYALALKSTFDFEKGSIMLIVTLIYAFISILGVGSFMCPILQHLEISKQNGKSASINQPPVEVEYDQERTRSEGGSSLQTNNCVLRFKRGFSNFNQKYFAPLFIRYGQFINFIRNMREFKRNMNDTNPTL